MAASFRAPLWRPASNSRASWAPETALHAQRVMQSFQARAERAGVPFEGCFARTDRVADAIIEVAAQRGCDLIVMATHVHGLFAELFASSNTKRVMARCKLPLLVLH